MTDSRNAPMSVLSSKVTISDFSTTTGGLRFKELHSFPQLTVSRLKLTDLIVCLFKLLDKTVYYAGVKRWLVTR